MAATEICIVPTFQREELLCLCLESIRVAAPYLPIKIFSDRGECSQDLLHLSRTYNCGLTVRPAHRRFGNSYNLIRAMQSALLLDNPAVVHMVENDTVISKDYFIWARKMLKADANTACSYGHISSDEVRQHWYESPAVSWDAEFLRRALAEIPDGYFAETREGMQQKLRNAFPMFKSSRGPGEQDSFFLCVIEKYQWRTVHPHRPLCTHLGWYGYNRPADEIAPQGTFAERVEACRKMLADKKARGKHFGTRITNLELEMMPQ